MMNPEFSTADHARTHRAHLFALIATTAIHALTVLATLELTMTFASGPALTPLPVLPLFLSLAWLGWIFYSILSAFWASRASFGFDREREDYRLRKMGPLLTAVDLGLAAYYVGYVFYLSSIAFRFGA